MSQSSLRMYALQVVTSDPDEITPAQRMTAGAMAGACAQATIYPFELVRLELQPRQMRVCIISALQYLAMSLACCACCKVLLVCRKCLQVRTRLAVCPADTYRGIADCVKKVLAQVSQAQQPALARAAVATAALLPSDLHMLLTLFTLSNPTS